MYFFQGFIEFYSLERFLCTIIVQRDFIDSETSRNIKAVKIIYNEGGSVRVYHTVALKRIVKKNERR